MVTVSVRTQRDSVAMVTHAANENAGQCSRHSFSLPVRERVHYKNMLRSEGTRLYRFFFTSDMLQAQRISIETKPSITGLIQTPGLTHKPHLSLFV